MMDGVVKRSFLINLKILRLLGLYPSKNHPRWYLPYGYILLCWCLIPDPLFGGLYFLKVEESNVMDGGFNLFLLVAMVCFVPKLIPFIRNNGKIRECIYFLEISINVSLNQEQKKTVDECVYVCKRNSIFFLVCVLIDGLTWSVRPLFQSNRELPLNVWLPFDLKNNAWIFYFAYIVAVMGCVYSGLTSAAIDPLVGGLAYHSAGQLKVLKDNLQNLNDYVDKEILRKNNCLKSEIIYERIKECAQHHEMILSFVKEIEACFSWVVFSQFVGSIVIICFCCLQLSQMEIGISFVLMIGYLMTALIQIYFYCFYGTTLYDENNTLTTAVYLSQWYEYDVSSRKALIILMQKANMSVIVTAGKLLDLSLDTFTTILRRSYSLLAVLKNY